MHRIAASRQRDLRLHVNFIASSDGRMDVGGHHVRCALGRSGVKPAADKREGDGFSPAGVWPIRRVLYRADRGPAPRTLFDLQPISRHDGWCDDPKDKAYNTAVYLPYPASAETMWREDGHYDVVVVLGHNDDPVVKSAGSAIFMHVAAPEGTPTAGCIALSREDLVALLRMLTGAPFIEIRAEF